MGQMVSLPSCLADPVHSSLPRLQHERLDWSLTIVLCFLQEDCNLVVDFPAFPALILKLLNMLVEQPQTYLGLLVLRADGSAVLEFAQNLDFKCMSLLSMRVEAVPQAMVRGYVTMRHNALLDRCAELEAELFELRALVSVGLLCAMQQHQAHKSCSAALLAVVTAGA